MSKFFTFYARRGNQVFLREKDGDRTNNLVIKGFRPRLFVRTDKDTGIRSMYGESVEEKVFDDMSAATDHAKRFGDVEGYKIYGTKDYALDYVCQRYGKPEYDQTKIKTATIDIEVKAKEFPIPSEAKYPIDLLTVHDKFTDRYHCLSLYDFDVTDERISGLDVNHHKFESEASLLSAFLHLWQDMNADNTTGWNTEGFDFPYLYFRIIKVLGESAVKLLSPFGKVECREVRGDFGNTFYKIDMFGIQDLDYLNLYKKHTYVTRESYRLGFIGEAEGVGSKLAYEDNNLYDLAERDPQTYQVYNIIDVNLVVELDRKLKLLDVTYALTYLTMSNFADTLGTTRVWQNFVYSYLLMQKNQVPITEKERGDVRAFPGGFVKEPVPGKYKWASSFDFASLYPHLTMHQNLGPETFVDWHTAVKMLNGVDGFEEYANRRFVDDLSDISIDKCVDKNLPPKLVEAIKAIDVCMAPNGSLYRRDERSFFGEMMDFVYQQRKAVKKEMLRVKQEKVDTKDDAAKKVLEDRIASLDAMQMALKILINSGYGAISNEHFIFFKIDVAEAITTGGQVAVRWVSNSLNQFLNQFLGMDKDLMIYSDTDSVGGDSKITVNGAKMPIEQFYSECDDKFIKYDEFNENYVKEVKGITSLGYDSESGEIVEREVKHVMKHKVKKRMFKIVVGGKEVIVTEDHSVIVNRNGVILSVKPEGILKTDSLILSNEL